MGQVCKCGSRGGDDDAESPFLALQMPVNRHPQRLDLRILNRVNHGGPCCTRAEYILQGLDLAAVKADLAAALKESQPWWPADWGHYGPFMVRLAWHQAGTYRTFDGRGGANGGNMRFNPLDSWPDNGNLDKARRLLWPIKQKYGRKLSWADLLVLVGNVAMEDMGFTTFGFCGGRVDASTKEEDVYWGLPESFQGLAKDASRLENPLGAAVMSLIYVNPEGPDGIPDPLLAAGHIRETFGRMAMNDVETVALIAGGHTFGKCHGAAPGEGHQGPPPSEAALEEQGFGWSSTFGTGRGGDAITSGLEGAWTAEPTKWDHGYFHNLFAYDWELYKGPGGANQWRPKNGQATDEVPLAHDATKKTHPIMLTTDLSLKVDPAYLQISKNFHEEPDKFKDAFARAWYKLTHRDMGPLRRGLGPEVPKEDFIWQDPITPAPGQPISGEGVKRLKDMILKSTGLSVVQLVSTAWASACTFRHTDFRGGANGARLRLAPQKHWVVNKPGELKGILEKLNEVQKKFNDSATSGEKVSMADLIVLAGSAGVEEGARQAGNSVEVAFSAGRGDATDEQTDVESFSVLEPTTDAFRNYRATPFELLDRAHLLQLTAPEMAVLVAGLRVLGVTGPGAEELGVLTETPGRLDNAFFVNLLDMRYEWKQAPGARGRGGVAFYEGFERGSSILKWKASAVDMSFGSNPELRAIAESFACSDSKQAFCDRFAAAWTKVMDNDKYDGSF